MTTTPRRVLVVGVLLNDRPNLAREMTRELQSSVNFAVDVKWVSLGTGEASEELSETIVRREATPRDKFALVNAVLQSVSLDGYEWIVVVDDDVDLAPGWLDAYLSLQGECGLALSQPARTAKSFISHPFTTTQPGFDARETSFVEIGPVFSLHRSAFPTLLPFDEAWPMGWGMESQWSVLCRTNGLRMGIIDAFPVGHSFRQTTTSYDHGVTEQKMRDLLSARSLPPVQALQHVTGIFISGSWTMVRSDREPQPKLSVVITTRDRPTYLARVLDSLVSQSIQRGLFEVIIIDDGSQQPLDDVVRPFRSLLAIELFRQRPTGIGAARNLGLFVARGEIVLLIDDDDWLQPDSLGALLAAHHHWGDPGDVLLGLTTLDREIYRDFLMSHASTMRGGQLFNYSSFASHAALSWREFWGGRVSVKREFLLRNGLFDTEFDFGAEDLELAWRLRPHGLRVFYEPLIEHVLFRRMTVDDLLRRSEKQGFGLSRFFERSQDEEALSSTAYDPRVDLTVDVAHLDEFVRNGLRIAQELTDQSFEYGTTFSAMLDAALRLRCAEAFQRGFRRGELAVRTRADEPTEV